MNYIDLNNKQVLLFLLLFIGLIFLTFKFVKFERFFGPVGGSVIAVWLQITLHQSLIGFGEYWLVGLFMLIGLVIGEKLYPLHKRKYKLESGSEYNVPINTNTKFYKFNYIFIGFTLAFMLVTLLATVVMFGTKVDKINWSSESGVLRLCFFASQTFGVVASWITLQFKFYKSFAFIIVIALVGGFVIGSKGALIPFLMVFIYWYRSQKSGIINLKMVIACFIFVLFCIQLIFYDLSSNGLTELVSRIVLSADSVLAFATGQSTPPLKHGFLYHAFSPITFKLIEKDISLGPALASISPIAYPENGGPNDSVYAYFMVSDLINKIQVCIYTLLISILHIKIDTYYSRYSKRNVSVIVTAVLLPLCINFSGFYQGVGTNMLILARYYMIATPILILLLFMFGNIKRKNEVAVSI